MPEEGGRGRLRARFDILVRSTSRKAGTALRLLRAGDFNGLREGVLASGRSLRDFWHDQVAPLLPFTRPFHQPQNASTAAWQSVVGDLIDGAGRPLGDIVREILPRLEGAGRVAVIVPCHDCHAHIDDTIASVQRQSYRDIEIIIVDDGSDDARTSACLERLAGRRMRVIRQPNAGPAAARNRGAEQAAEADYLLFLDADDLLHEHAVALLLWWLKANPAAAYAYPDQRFFGGKELLWQCQDYNAYDLLWSNHPSVTALIRAAAFKEVGGFPAAVTRGEDWALWQRLAAAGHHGTRFGAPLFLYRRHGENRSLSARRDDLVRQLHDAARPAYLPAAIAGAKGRWRPAVSVIIPFYNAHEHVDETLASLRRQTIFGDLEVIVIDDGSDDPDSLAKLDELRRLDWLRVVRIAHAGLPAARNAGAREARSEYLYYLDADDFIDPTTLEKLVLLLATHPRADFAYNGVVHFGDIEGVGINRFDPERLKRENFIVFSSLIRKETYFRLGGMDEALIDNYEDYDFWLRLLEEGGHGVLLPEPLFHYRRHIKSNRNVLIKQRDERRMLADLRARHPALYGKSETVDRGGWRLLRATPTPHERLRREAGLAALSELPADLPVRGYRRPNLPNPFSPLRWEGEERRILYLLPYFTIGGAEQVDLAILAGLKERGWRITLAACEEHHHPWKERFLAMSEDHFLLPSFGRDEERRLQVLEYLMISRNADVLFIRNAAVGYKLARRLREVTRQVAAVDLLHLHNFGRDWVGFSAPYHDALDRRFVITEDLLRHAVDTYGLSPERFRVIYNGVDFTTPPAHPAAARIAALRAAGAQLVGFCGRFDAEGQKDPLRWLETAARIHAVKPHARFVMIGDGPRLATAKKRAARLGIAGAVTFTGYVDDPRPLLAELDALMLTSRYEGLPMVVLEALAQGVRVVATDAGGTREALLDGEMGAIVPLDAAPEVIADAAGVVLDRAAQRRLFDPRLRRAVKSRFDLQRQKKAYADNLEELVLGLDHRRRLDDYQLRVMQRAIVP